MKLVRSILSLVVIIGSLSAAFAAEVLPEVKVPGDATVKVALPLDWKAGVETYKKMVILLAAPEMDGRGPGTKGIEKARDYLANELKQLGLKPAFKVGDAEPSFIQPFEISAGVRAKEQSLVLVDKEGKKLLTPVAGEQYSARGFSGDAEVTGEAVFVGYGAISAMAGYDSYSDLPKDGLKGKVAVAYRFEPVDAEGKPTLFRDAKPGQWGEASNLVNKAKWAAERGAAALVVVDPPSQDKGGRLPTASETQGGSATIPVIQITSDVFRTMLRSAGLGDESVAKQYEREANQGLTKFKPLAPVQLAVKVKMERVKATIHNVAAVLPGAGKLKDEYIVIGGHYDHLGYGDMGSLARTNPSAVHHGADDNASGTAGVILSAMQLTEAAKKLDSSADRRSTLFVLFSGEERGLLGSAHMLRKPEELNIKLDQMVAMLNMDMTGRMEGNKLIASGAGSGEKFEDLILATAKPLNIDVAPASGMGIGGSDHQSFHAKNIPAVHFFTGVHPDYHKPSDTADKINNEGGTKTATLVSALTIELWQVPQRVKFQTVRMAHPASGGPRGSGAYLGIVPNYASIDAEDGCMIDGTSNGSPAAAAGLKADDVIIKWDAKPVKNLHDLTARIGESKAGQEVTLKVKRDGKEVDVKVKLGTR